MSFRDSQHETSALKRILDVARKLSAPFELRALLSEIIDAGRDVLSADRGSVFLFDAKTNELYTVVAHGVKEIRFPIEKGIAGECARTRKIVNVPDCYADPRFNQEIDRKTGYRTNCLITVPLVGIDDELVGVMQLLNSALGRFDESDEYLAVLIASQAATAIQRVKLMDDRLERMKLHRELELARKIQMAVLPQELPPVPGYDVATYSNPADQTGGDIFDVIAIRHNAAAGRSKGGASQSGAGQRGASQEQIAEEIMTNALFLLLADATGHGVGPAISVTQVRSMLRVGLRLCASLDELFHHINSQLTMDLASERFVTAFFGMLDPARHHVAYLSAGQAPILHFRAARKQCEFRDACTLPMGIMEDPPTDVSPPIELAPGDMLVMLTDGFYEYQNGKGDQMGKDRIGETVVRVADKSAKEVLDALLADVADFARGAPQLDDVTGLIVKRLA